MRKHARACGRVVRTPLGKSVVKRKEEREGAGAAGVTQRKEDSQRETPPQSPLLCMRRVGAEGGSRGEKSSAPPNGCQDCKSEGGALGPANKSSGVPSSHFTCARSTLLLSFAGFAGTGKDSAWGGASSRACSLFSMAGRSSRAAVLPGKWCACGLTAGAPTTTFGAASEAYGGIEGLKGKFPSVAAYEEAR